MGIEQSDGNDPHCNPPSLLAVQKLLSNLISQSQLVSKPIPSFVKIKGESRPYANLTILGQTFPAMLDSGATRTVCGSIGAQRLLKLGFKYAKSKFSHPPAISTADDTPHVIKHQFSIPVHFDGSFAIIEVLSAPTMPLDIVLGTPFMHSFKMGIFSPNSVWFPSPPSEDGSNGVNALADCEEYEALEEEKEQQRDLTDEQLALLQPIIDRFKELGDIPLGRTQVITHDIDTEGKPPCFTGTRPLSPAKEKKIEQEFLRFKQLGVVEPAQTAFRNAMTVVEKMKMGKLKLRLCLDSRKLNAITKVEKYDLPRIPTILARLGEAKFISKIDLKDAYLQIPLTERSKEKTAFFVRGHGVWQFITMPFGLVNCSATMQRLMDHLFGDLDGEVFVYQDDLVIVNRTFEEHLIALQIVADKLKCANLSINFPKSGFCLRNMRYMGYVVDELGLRPDPEKVSCVLKVPLPKTVTELRRFLGMAGWYRRFIHCFATVAAPMHDLVKGGGKGRKLVWDEKSISCFEKMKQCLVSAPLLQTPDFTKPFFIYSDASDGCIGGVLTQFCEDDPKQDRPIAYVSRKLRGAEMHYDTTEKECLAVVFCVDKFSEFVEGTEFTVCTDHSALTWLFKKKDLTGRLARWVLSLQQHHMNVKHVKGKHNVVADAISRFPIVQILNYICLLDLSRPSTDPWYDRMMNKVKSGRDRSHKYKVVQDKLFYNPSRNGRKLSNWNWKYVVPHESRPGILLECHDDPKSAHLGTQKTIDRILTKYYWPGVSVDVKKYVRECKVCQMSKSRNDRPAGLMGNYRPARSPWQMISMDLLGPFPRSRNGHVALLVVSDWFTKYPCLMPLRTTVAKTIVKSVEERIFLEYSVPQTVVMDNGPQFARSNEIKSLLQRYGIKRLWNNCIHHPQSNFTERHNKTIGAALRSYIKENHKDWDKFLPQISLALRLAVNSITGYSPFFLNHAREYVSHPDDYLLSEVEVNDEDAVLSRSKFIRKFHEIQKDICRKMEKSHERNKRYYDRNRLERSLGLGDKVYYRNRVQSDAAKHFCKKLAPLYMPGVIVTKLSPLAYEVSDEDGNNVRKFHIQDLRPRNDSSIAPVEI